jgi:Niemann-Pick C1 protein
LIDGRIPPDKFYSWVNEFLTNDTQIGPYYRSDVIWAEGRQSFVASRLFTYSVGLQETSDYVNAINNARKAVEDELGTDAFPYSIFYIYFEQYLALGTETLRNLALSLAGVFIVGLMLMGNIWMALLMFLAVVVMLVETLGGMYFLNIDLNAISLVNLLLSIAISIEFTGHLGVRFLNGFGADRDERAKEMMIEMVPPVFSGGVCTFLGIVALAGTTYRIFQVYYFRMYMLMLGVATFNGLILFPVLLSFIGPMNHPKNHPKNMVEEGTELPEM